LNHKSNKKEKAQILRNRQREYIREVSTTMAMITQVKTRKEQRKESRKKRKRHAKSQPQIQTLETNPKKSSRDDGNKNNPKYPKVQIEREQRKKRKKMNTSGEENEAGEDSSQYTNHPDIAEDTCRDDMEIADLEKKLGMTGTSKNKTKAKEKLNKEYAKLEGYGDNFGDFLDDMDDLVNRVTITTTNQEYSAEDNDRDFDSNNTEGNSVDLKENRPVVIKKKKKKHVMMEEDHDDDGVPYNNVDSNMTDAIRRDNEEIADLEKKLGLSKRNEKEKLYKEYSKLEGFGDDFGGFLDDLDNMMVRLKRPSADYDKDDDINSNRSSEDESDHESKEEILPMNDLDEAFDEDDSILDEVKMLQNENDSDFISNTRKEDQTMKDQAKSLINEASNDDKDTNSSDSNSDDYDNDSDGDDEQREPDHDVADTYRPSEGEDIYGNIIDSDKSDGNKPFKYVPPHLREKKCDGSENEGEKEQRRVIQRSLNNCLNRLSEDTLISVSKQIAQLYSSSPTPTVHELIWKNAKDACINSSMLMVGLIPVYTACITGVHVLTGDTIQVGESILENVVVDLWDRLGSFRKSTSDNVDSNQIEVESKQICNLMLFLGYLYNYNIVHCSFIYDIIRNLIENFSEVDIECLLILLSHCGKSLRSDDPMALRDIVLIVQKKKMQNVNLSSSSRMEYMVSAIMDLKNNRRKREDTALTDTAGKFRKILGRIKASAAKSGISKSSSEASMRISLDDILHVDTKGRWWKVGASWVGNQYRFLGASQQETIGLDKGTAQVYASTEDGDESLLKLASKLRMNTDRKRSIFCIIMGGTDCDDTFEKLCRFSMLQNRNERDTVRVLMECCGHEKSYNKFYGHLAARICEYQPQSKFSLQLAYWDIFKQFDSTGARKCANLAKLLFHLVVTHQALKILPVIKTIDLSDDEMDEVTLVFLTILFSSILDYFDDPSQAKAFFTRRMTQSEERDGHNDRDEGIRAGILVFFIETLKSSPKNEKGSRFHKNFKAVVKELDTDGFDNIF